MKSLEEAAEATILLRRKISPVSWNGGMRKMAETKESKYPEVLFQYDNG